MKLVSHLKDYTSSKLTELDRSLFGIVTFNKYKPYKIDSASHDCYKGEMNSKSYLLIHALILAALISKMGFAATNPTPSKISSAKVEFTAETNVKLFRFKGASEAVTGSATKDQGHLKNIEISVPVASIKTGMEMRDEHMRKRVFTKKDGSTPDIKFTATDVACETDCKIAGTLTLRGESRPQTLDLKIDKSGAFTGTTEVKINDYGIETQSQAGVSVANTVKVEFSGKLQ